MIYRILEKQILKSLRPGRAVCLLGARRTGKTVLMQRIKGLVKTRALLVQGDNLEAAEILGSQRLEKLRGLVRGYGCLMVDEAQAVPNIGPNLKLLIDNEPGLTVFITGSSAFDLKGRVGEPLVGRSLYLHLYPISQLELMESEDSLTASQRLESRLIYGAYPQVITAETEKEKRDHLQSIRDGYLLKDILALDNLKDSLFVFNLLRMLAFQIGQDVSFAELASNLNVHAKTVRRYLELLEKTFALFSHQGYSRNLRKEYTKSPRYYFWDNGIRNALISNFNPLHLRDDAGRLWENYCITERIKRNAYKQQAVNYYFWRTYDQKEIDLIEERGGRLHGYEFKWAAARAKKPLEFLSAYKDSAYRVVNRDNYLDYIAR
ncbi:MAG: ATP-binding protein [Candidatus Edwardsbacteria bacterium]|nr:ATP-binding protein [Candidatus Edwardsbacteria bacterium]